MTTITATVRGGRLEVAEPIDLPDGTELRIPLPEPNLDGPLSPDELARALAAMDRLQPFDMTGDEPAAMEAARQAQKEREKAEFAAEGERLKRMWADALPPR